MLKSSSSKAIANKILRHHVINSEKYLIGQQIVESKSSKIKAFDNEEFMNFDSAHMTKFLENSFYGGISTGSMLRRF